MVQHKLQTRNRRHCFVILKQGLFAGSPMEQAYFEEVGNRSLANWHLGLCENFCTYSICEFGFLYTMPTTERLPMHPHAALILDVSKAPNIGNSWLFPCLVVDWYICPEGTKLCNLCFDQRPNLLFPNLHMTAALHTWFVTYTITYGSAKQREFLTVRIQIQKACH